MPAAAPTLPPPQTAPAGRNRHWGWILAVVGGLVAVVLWRVFSGGSPESGGAQTTGGISAVLEIGVLVFREGLECILILAAITGGLSKTGRDFRRPIYSGAGAGIGLTVGTWFLVVGILDGLGHSVSALNLQAATGLLAVIVLIVVMNWFFHKLYWTGWISLHNRRKRQIVGGESGARGRAAWWWGLAALGLTTVYREGVEVVLFLQSYRLRLGNHPVVIGVIIGLALTVMVGVLTFLAHRRLPYRRMLVFTGVLLGIVFLVMVGEQVQEMQLAHWMPAAGIPWLSHVVPHWAGLWFSVFPDAYSLAAQAVAAAVVLGSYFVARERGAAAAGA